MIVSSNSTDKTDGRPGLYSALSLLHNWLQDGHYQPEAAPDFEPLPAAEPAGPETDRSAAALAGGSSGLRSAAQRLPGNDSLEQVHQEIQRCLKCRLAGSRNRTVPGQGAARPLVLVIGEAPDAEDNNSGQAFSGAAGVLLDRMLAAIQLSRSSNCYLLHVVKCYPPAGRDPAPDEQTCCAEYLKR
ncbi:MAG: uracil-DNA glycosylase, partial [Spirochaetes bacterium]|nr:uracil-DNA glycosylase [Spirochaetota bacterium]